jgi:exonuclease SbcC
MLPEPGDASTLRAHADQLAATLERFIEDLSRHVEDLASAEARLLTEATGVTDGLVAPEPTLEALAAAVDRACRAATAEAATAADRARDLAERVERRKELSAEAKLLDERSAVFKTLARELDARHIIPVLQEEALQLLAAAGSERLSNLSSGRYRLAFRDDEFLVVDTWNGDEERSVRTLSGGETFLASLSLALALADQVRSLSTTDRARLDSLFLDEGFGTLDPETLQVVVDAIELLAGDGRLVGVITHVQDLAEHFPRIEVEKSTRGSRLKDLAI